MKGMAVGCTLSVSKTNSLPNDRRPGFLKGTIAKVADDGKSFWVHFEKAQGTREGDESLPQAEGLRGFQGEGLRGFQVHRNQQVMPLDPPWEPFFVYIKTKRILRYLFFIFI